MRRKILIETYSLLTQFNLEKSEQYRDLVARYAKHWMLNPPFSAKRFTLAARSPRAHDVMSFAASQGKFLFKELTHQVDLIDFSQEWLLELTEVIHRNPLLQNHWRFAAQILRHYAKSPEANVSEPWLENYARLLLDLGRFGQLETLIEKFPKLTECNRGYLLANLYNPHGAGSPGDGEKWLAAWQAFFAQDGNPAPLLTAPAERPFDRLAAPEGLTPVLDGPLVTVVMTAYNPDPVAFRTSIRSILQQTWQNLELLIVDDASAPEFAADIAAVAKLDPRIRVLHLDVNGGTYLARNAGWELARGEFLTGQDADDWAHPQRIEKQVQAMIKDPEIATSTSMSTRVYDDLSFVTNRVQIAVRNESSLMVRTAELPSYGSYLPIRKGADSELRMRISAVTGKQDHYLTEVLSVVRSTPGSLSTSDFAAGWAHPARGSFSQSMVWWHNNAPQESLPYVKNSPIPFPVPDYLATKTPEHIDYDLVLTSTWTGVAAEPGMSLHLIPALSEKLPKLGLFQLQSAKLRSATYATGHPAMLKLLQERAVRQVISSDQHTARALVITDPTLLNFENHNRIGLNVESLYVIATEDLITPDSPDHLLGYYPGLVEDYLDEMVGRRPVWIPVNAKVRAALQQHYPGLTLSTADLGMPLSPSDIRHPRTYFRSTLPIIGRFAGADQRKWPAERADFAAAYPDDPNIEIRTCGRIPRGLRGAVVGQKNKNWLTFDYEEIPVNAFLNSIDFYVNFDQETALEDSLPEIRRALAAGLVAILPEHYREHFGDGALYCEPAQVTELVRELFADPDRYFAQSQQAITFVKENHSPHVAAQRLLDIIGHGPTEKP